MYANKKDVLINIVKALNNENNPWQVSVEDDVIVGTWKWMDARFFDYDTITEEQENYRFEVILTDYGKWRENDISESKKLSFNPFSTSFSSELELFSGNSWNKSIKIGFGKNKETEEVGIIKFDFDTNKIKKPIRDYLIRCGYSRE